MFKFIFPVIFLGSLLGSLFFSAHSAFSASISFIGPCSEVPIFTAHQDLRERVNVGKFTLDILEDNQINFIGSEWGMSSIFNTPTGMDALEIVNKDEMYAYGWCYAINNVEPKVYPNEVFLEPHEDDQIVWWFGYAHYKRGEWMSPCEPSYLRKPVFICD